LLAHATFVAVDTHLVSGTQKMFLMLFRTFCVRNNIHFVSRAFARPRNIIGNNVSSFLAGPLHVVNITKKLRSSSRVLVRFRQRKRNFNVFLVLHVTRLRNTCLHLCITSSQTLSSNFFHSLYIFKMFVSMLRLFDTDSLIYLTYKV